MSENDIDKKRLEELRKNVRNRMKEREEDRSLGVKTSKSGDSKVIKNELNSSTSNKAKKGKSSIKKGSKSGKSANKKSKTTTKGKKNNKNTKKNAKKVSILLVILMFGIGAIYSLFGKGYLLDLQREEFIEMVEPIASDLYEEYGIYPSITISRAAIESNWGKSGLSKEAFNLFGIKADKSWKGKTIKMTTKEGYDDTQEASFRRYKSYKESIYDYGNFLSSNKRYEKAGLFKAKNYKEQAQVLEDAGYATKENSKGELVYADVLINLIERYELYKVDAMHGSKSK